MKSISFAIRLEKNILFNWNLRAKSDFIQIGSWFMRFFSQKLMKTFTYILQSETFKIYEITVFTRYVWYSTTLSKAHKHFDFILTEKYGSFLTFWAPFQLCSIKSRFWSSSQTIVRTHFRRNASKCIKSDQIGIS